MQDAAVEMEAERKLRAKKHREEVIQEMEEAAKRANKTEEDSTAFLTKMGKEGYIESTDTLESRIGKMSTRRQRGLDSDFSAAKFV